MGSFIRTASLVLVIGLLGTPVRAQLPKPGNLQATATGPTTVSLTWTAAAGANGYVVQRGTGTAALDRLTPTKISGTAYTDAAAPAVSTLRYRIRALFANAQSSLSDIASVTTQPASPNTASGSPADPQTGGATPAGSTVPGQPTTTLATSPGATVYQGGQAVAMGSTFRRTAPTLTAVTPATPETPATTAGDPAHFTAAVQADKVVLTWDAVPGVSWYLLGGPTMSLYGQQVQGTSYAIRGLGVGQYEWTVASLSDARSPLTNGATWPKAQLNLTPDNITAGRYRVTLNGFTVNRESWDNMFETDGKRDEVYLAADVVKYDKAAATPPDERVVKTITIGDANGFPDRLAAGSASGAGGLMTGNSFPNQPDPWNRHGNLSFDRLPLLLWEGNLLQGQSVVVITPTVWEWDGEPRVFNWWSTGTAIAQSITTTITQDRKAQGVFDGLLGRADLQPFEFPRDDQHAISENGTQKYKVDGADRPIGMRMMNSPYAGNQSYRYHEFAPKTVALTVRGIETALQNTSSMGGRGAGIVEVRYQDEEDWKGDYTLYLQVERIQQTP
ncbi:MAG: hypothetical protein ACJ8BF_06595 [Gemmatimonadales bacterium]